MAHPLDSFVEHLVSLVTDRVVEHLERSGRLAAPTPRAAHHDDPNYVTTRQAAGMIGITKRQLESLRRQGRGPKWVVTGDGCVRYPLSTLLDR